MPGPILISALTFAWLGGVTYLGLEDKKVEENKKAAEEASKRLENRKAEENKKATEEAKRVPKQPAKCVPKFIDADVAAESAPDREVVLDGEGNRVWIIQV